MEGKKEGSSSWEEVDIGQGQKFITLSVIQLFVPISSKQT